MKPAFLRRLAERWPEREVSRLDTGCCGMAGAFGTLTEKYELSIAVAQPLAEKVRNQPYGTVIVASGTSSRHQIDHATPKQTRHKTEKKAEAQANRAD